MLRTHLAVTILAIMLFFSHISGWLDKLIFVAVALIATYIPDIDSGFSTIGKGRVAKIFQIFVKHRGVFHSFTLCIAVSLLFAYFIPVLALPFFLGYGLHLFADSFSIEGIKPFWPYPKILSWKLRTGGKREIILLISLIIIDLLVLVWLIKGAF